MDSPQRLDERGWTRWLVSIDIREELAAKYAKALVEEEYDTVGQLEGLDTKWLQEHLGMKSGTALKVISHFSPDDNGPGGGRVLARGSSSSSTTSTTGSSSSTTISSNISPSTYQWEWQQEDGIYLAYTGEQELIETSHRAGKESVIITSMLSFFELSFWQSVCFVLC